MRWKTKDTERGLQESQFQSVKNPVLEPDLPGLESQLHHFIAG